MKIKRSRRAIVFYLGNDAPSVNDVFEVVMKQWPGISGSDMTISILTENSFVVELENYVKWPHPNKH